ncbi:hypothetical protein M8J75_008553 [Diaphorina citri]|nr:hypothetical protein M8J75_008553 [Diaphorina citri]
MDFNVVKLDIDKLILVLQDCLDKVSHLGLKDATHLAEPPKSAVIEQDEKASTALTQFLESFHLFIQYTRQQLEQACIPGKYYSKSEELDWEDIKQDRQEEIRELQMKIHVIKEKYKREEEKKKQLIAEYKKALEMIESRKKEELNEIARTADERMIQEWQTIEYELNNLQSEEKLVQRKHEYLCKENLTNEKSLRDEKSKCENKLEQFIALYDKDIGKKHAEYENMLHQMDLEKQQLMTLIELFELQKPDYQIMTEEKAVWREKELARKLHKLRTMLAHNTISKFLNNYVKTLRENNIPIVITKKSKGKKKKQ